MMRRIAYGQGGRKRRRSVLLAYAATAIKSSAAAMMVLGGLSGCKEWRSPPASQPTVAPTADGSTVTANAVRLAGVDESDDPKSPACLPRTESSEGRWVKREPVVVYPASRAAEVFGPETAARIHPFRLKLLARCAYALTRTSGKPVMASVIHVETISVDDAYGLLTCLSDSAEAYRIGGETRVAREGGLTFHCWQGRVYLSVSSSADDSESTEEMIRLLMHICGCIPGEDVPAMLSAFPVEGRQRGRCWLVRRAESLPLEKMKLESDFSAVKVSEILGLGRDTLMGVASYESAAGHGPNVVWVVRYPSIKAANDAYARYARLIQAAQAPVARSASLLAPQGAYLIGTWTAEEESLQYVLPRIVELLPS